MYRLQPDKGSASFVEVKNNDNEQHATGCYKNVYYAIMEWCCNGFQQRRCNIGLISMVYISMGSKGVVITIKRVAGSTPVSERLCHNCGHQAASFDTYRLQHGLQLIF